MEVVKVILYLVIMPVFLFSIFISLKFQWTSEGKDERGKTIINKAFMFAMPIFPIGWLLESLYNDYIQAVPYDFYRIYIEILLSLTFIIHGMVILYHKRKM